MMSTIRTQQKWRADMTVEMDCPICDAPIPLDNNERSGDIIQCSFCKEFFKLLQTKDKGLVLIEEFEE